MKNTLLISYKTLTQNSEVPENISPAVILPLIKDVQEMHVEPILGTALFEKIQNDIEAGTLAGNYKDLVTDYIAPVLIYGVLTDLVFTGNYRFSPAGIITHTPGGAQSSVLNAEFKDLQKISDFYKSKIVWRAGKLTDYISKNVSNFPEYSEFQSCKDAPQKETYQVGIYLGK